MGVAHGKLVSKLAQSLLQDGPSGSVHAVTHSHQLKQSDSAPPEVNTANLNLNPNPNPNLCRPSHPGRSRKMRLRTCQRSCPRVS